MLDANLSATEEPDIFYVKITPHIPDDAWQGIVGPALPQSSVIFPVDHQNQLRDMLRPRTPPDVRVMKNTPTEVMVSLRATDPATTHLALSYCVKSPVDSSNPMASGEKNRGETAQDMDGRVMNSRRKMGGGK